MFAMTVGIGVSLINIVIHGLLTAVMVRAVKVHSELRIRAYPLLRVIAALIIAATILKFAHLIEIWVWSLCYAELGVTPEVSEDFTFAFVNYTTLGYGHVVPLPPWQVLGPMTAMNGVLLFGWSTAVLFQVMTEASRQFGFKY